MHVLESVAAEAVEKEETPHFRHFSDPAYEYVPVPHIKHEELLFKLKPDEYFPAEHFRQVSAAVAPSTVEYVPASHWEHTVMRFSPRYVPGLHLEQFGSHARRVKLELTSEPALHHGMIVG